MRRVTLPTALALSAFLLAGCADQADMEETEAVEEAAPAADFAGTWNATAYMESGDTVPYTMTATATTDGWMIDLPDRDPMPMAVTIAGDTVTADIGPYESILRPGVMVTVHSVTHLEDGGMVGTMQATYDTEEGETVVGGTVEASRGM